MVYVHVNMTTEAAFAAARANAARSCQSERHRGSFSKPGRFWPSGFDFLGWPHFKAWKERNTTIASLSGGSFSVTNGTLSCGGDYNALDQSPTISIPVLCNDGRKGIILATRDYSGTSGGGHFTLNDGTTGDFMFGAAAQKL
jgi:hypothetical protein